MTAEAMIEGTQNTHKIFAKVLQDHGIEIVDPVGEKFDPEVHEAMSMVPSEEHEKNTIVNVFQKGYFAAWSGCAARPWWSWLSELKIEKTDLK